jgi:hypothetical protein
MKRSAEALYSIYGMQNMAASQPVKRPLVTLSTGAPPMFEKADLFPATASAFNKATEYNYSPNFLKDEEVYKLDEATIRYQIASGAYSGGRNIRETDLPVFKMKHGSQTMIHRIPEAHWLNVRSEAPKGYRTVNPVVRESTSRQKVLTTGAHNHMRAKGAERDFNPKIYPQLPVGLPMNVEPQRPVSDELRVNNLVVETIPTFPQIGF